MRAPAIHVLGEPPRLEDVPEPQAGAGQALVALGAAGINPIDIAIASGRYFAGSPDVPYVAGREGVGRIVSGDRFREGTRVYVGRGETGTLAERFVAGDEAY